MKVILETKPAKNVKQSYQIAIIHRALMYWLAQMCHNVQNASINSIYQETKKNVAMIAKRMVKNIIISLFIQHFLFRV